MPIRGDFPQLRDGISHVRKLGGLGPQVFKAAETEIRKRIEAQFNEGKNPYGTPWKPLAPATLRKGRHPPPLTDTGKMRASTVVAAMGDTLLIALTDPKAGFHQWGAKGSRVQGTIAKEEARLRASGVKGKEIAEWKKSRVRHAGESGETLKRTRYARIPKRQILPDGRVPDEWRQMLRRIAREIMAARLGRKPTRGEMG